MEPFPGYDEHKAAAEGQPEYVQKVYAYCKTPEHTTMALKQLEGSKKVTDQMRENDKSTEKKLVVQARIDAERRKAAELQATADDEKAAAVAEARKKRVDAERAQAEAERKAKIEAASGDADVEVAQTAAASKKQNVQKLGDQASCLASKDDDDEPEVQLIESPQPPPLKKQKTTPKETPDDVVKIDDDDAPPPGAPPGAAKSPKTLAEEVGDAMDKVLGLNNPMDEGLAFLGGSGGISAKIDQPTGQPTVHGKFDVRKTPREAAVADQLARDRKKRSN